MYIFFSYKYIIMYKKKYLKYKLKYLNLKNKQKGGSKKYESFEKFEDSDLTYEKLLSELEKVDNKIIIVCYAPWCGHCKRFMDAEEGNYLDLINDDEINIYKVDFTQKSSNLDNIQQKFLELDDVLGQIVAFPTLLKIDTKTKIISHFKGDRDNKIMIIDYFNE